jgi:6,7-dimethyl-8-ribityllumazine synthase
MDALIAGAIRTIEQAGATYALVRVPGTFELPVAVSHAVYRNESIADESASFDGIVTLGVVIRGGTPHFEYVCQAATDGLNRVALETGIPVGFGVLTCDTVEQARDRAGLPGSSEDKGAEAAEAAIATVVALEKYRK